MKKFIFSLQKVLEIKEQILENLKIELGNLNQEYSTMELNIKNLKDKFSSVNSDFLEKSTIGVSVGEMSYYKIYMSSILKQIENKEEEKENLLKKIESKRQEIISKNIEISSLEKLKEKEYEKYNHALLKSEEIFIEEFVSNKSMTKGYAV
ncbi:MAG: flagellar export protein FliJ [Sedimentibacter sp.]|uniref:flagellar export protein FliJ n=1 Tax=Sedimentibacter sp. TaxID=1960295 RepID=UPI002980E93E|nr:flagellar export protein FliJ [Sedimentibacter sp.]MDW5298747.1 flagellar export protein FliJ [Sedimentibacter sp.]